MRSRLILILAAAAALSAQVRYTPANHAVTIDG